MIAGFTFPAIFLCATGYVGCNNMGAIAMVTLAIGLSGFGQSGYNLNHLDIASPFAGKLFVFV